MNNETTHHSFHLEPLDNHRLANLCGQLNENINLIEKRLGVIIKQRSNHFYVEGPSNEVIQASEIIQALYQETPADKVLSSNKVHMLLQKNRFNSEGKMRMNIETTLPPLPIRIKVQGENQQRYLDNIHHNPINFAIGPAGTGKTYLAVVCAVAALEEGLIQRIILVRPAVEAGEKLGFLPGDLVEKVDPYLRPLYDFLYEILGSDQVGKLLKNNIIEVAPLAFMRGRTLNDSFIILDEAQNCTIEQTKMFLTRIGFGARAVITGDVTQIDLPRHIKSGLLHAQTILQDIKGIGFSYFEAHDTVRHPLVQNIIYAYEKEGM